MRAFLALILAAAVSARRPSADTLSGDYTYAEYVKDFGKVSTREGEIKFTENLKEILRFNAEGHSYKKGVNQFTDGAPLPRGRAPSGASKAASLLDPEAFPVEVLSKELPKSVDWRESGVVSAVKNQGHCGSCWAFATTATVESHIAIATGNLFSLSPQQLVACAPNDDHCGGFGGCMGSIPELAYTYLVDAGGYAEEWSFPYVSFTGETNGTCSDPTIQAGIGGYVKLPENNASAVMAALAHIGPLAINVDASSWSSYEGGVFSDCGYDDMDIDHVVVLVGYGTDEDSGEDYWLVRNSWSPTWGEHGYIRLKRDPVDATPCGVDPQPQDGTGCDGDPTQYPCGQCGAMFDVSYPTGAFSN